MSIINLQGKVVAITGANGRLGRVLVETFAQQGAKIAAIVRSPEKAQEIPFPENAEGWAFVADVLDEASVQACFESIRQHCNRLDVFIHAVGHWEANSLLETTLADWKKVIDLNVTSAFLCFREAVRIMHNTSEPSRLIGICSRPGSPTRTCPTSRIFCCKSRSDSPH